MDLILRAFLESTEDSKREQLLSDLILFEAAPLVRNTLRHRLSFHVDRFGANPHNHDAEDVYHDVMTKLIALLNDPQLRAGHIVIKNFRQYVLRVATNACYDYLRAKAPARNRLKNNLRDLLERHQDFSLWRTESNETLCGFTEWRNHSKSLIPARRISSLEEKPEEFITAKFAHEDIRQAPLTRVVAEIFRWSDSPIGFDQLVSLTAQLMDVKDQPHESLDDDGNPLAQTLADVSFHCESSSEVRALLQILWKEVLRLPHKQRDVFCFSFADESGDDLFRLLVHEEIASLTEIAHALNRSLDNLTLLWQQMPMDNASIAHELGATRQQVNKWRFRALRQLEKVILTDSLCK
jgi:RNA polymerase sigma factor (sigma-70 family)